MATTVVIVGDLPDRPERGDFLDQLAAEAPEITWEWIQAADAAFRLPKKPLNKLRARLSDENKRDGQITVVKLKCLNGKDAHSLHQLVPDPILAPGSLDSTDNLREWLLSEEAGIVGVETWNVPVREAALLALLAKLIRNKSWNKSQRGHQWTQETDLLQQMPVNRPDHKLYGHAVEILHPPLFLTKGANQGKTKKEWCIQHDYISYVKQAITERTLDPLREHPDLADYMASVDRGPDERVLVDGEIITEKVRDICWNIR